jgi:outer membrane lipoprotein carrier protein
MIFYRIIFDMKRIEIFLLLAGSLLMTTAQAEKTTMEQLKAFLSGTQSLIADFKQVSFDQNGVPAQTSQGKFYLRRPGHFRWQYQQPFVQEIVSTGDKVWFYDADLEQVTIKPMDDSLGATPALLLSGAAELDNSFTMTQQGKDEDMDWIKLTPKNEESGFKYILLGMSKGELAGMELSDNFGQLTRIYFSDLQHNPPLDDNIFAIEIPPGVDVFGQ